MLTLMPRVLLLATTTGYQTRAFGEAAERLGVDLVFATDRCHVLEDPVAGSGDCRSGSTTRPDRRRRSSSRGTEQPLDGVLAVGDRPTVIAARVREGARASGPSAAAAAVARNKLRDARAPARGRPAGSLVPPDRSHADPRELRPIDLVPVRRQTARALRQPRRDARRRRAPSSSRRSIACGRCCSRPTSAASATTTHETGARRGVHRRPRVRARGRS